MSLWTRIKQALNLFYQPKTEAAKQFKDVVVQRYIDTGVNIGDAISFIHMGECVGFEKLLSAWERAEREYAALGYRTIPIDDFITVGGWGGDIDGILVKRGPKERPVFHATYYRENYLGKLQSNGLVQKAWDTGERQDGYYHLPSTAHLVANSNSKSEEEAV